LTKLNEENEMNPITLRRLTKDIPNPKFDGRCRYGAEAVKTFKEGTLIRHWVNDWMSRSDPHHVVSLGGRVWTHDIALSMVEESVPTVPQTVGEVLEAHDMNERWGMEVLQQLVAMQIVSLEQVARACVVMQEPEGEEK
jgi:hypothetical protein